MEIFIKHIAKLEASGLEPTNKEGKEARKKDLKLINDNPEYKLFFQECEQECKKMKNIKIANSTMFEIFVDKNAVNKLISSSNSNPQNYAKIIEITSKDGSGSKSNFPIYGSMLAPKIRAIINTLSLAHIDFGGGLTQAIIQDTGLEKYIVGCGMNLAKASLSEKNETSTQILETSTEPIASTSRGKGKKSYSIM